MVETLAGDSFGIYIHWPYCESKCPYCDFNSVVCDTVDQRKWARAFVNELVRCHRETNGRKVASVFFGGGTPSIMEPALVETILTCIAETWGYCQNPEITLEANPGSVEKDKFVDFRGAGVNRLSLGIQSLNDSDLKLLGRLHTVDEGLRAIEIAQSLFSRVSFDLIYARQDQSLENWQAELNRALALGTDHLSLYQLTIEPQTAFGRLHSIDKLPGLPEMEIAAQMYELTQDISASAGLPAYEISNHAKAGSQSIHNLIYWNCGDYLGIGPGAHGRITLGAERFATETHLVPEKWLQGALSESGESDRFSLTARDRAKEYLLMSLRLGTGCNLDRLETICRGLVNPININKLDHMDLITIQQGYLLATDAGRLVLNSVIKELLSE